MADKTTTSLTGATTPLDGAELHYVIQGGNSRKVAGSEIVKISHNQAWSTITSTPTTLSGYGITDAATSAQGGKADTALQPGDIGDTVQAHEDQLDDLAALAPGSDGQVIGWQDGELATFNAAGGGDLLSSNNLSDLDSAADGRDNLGLGTMATETASDYTKTADLAAVATSNDYSDLDNLPTLGTGAALDAPSDPDLSNDTDKLALRGDVDANLILQYAADDTALKGMDISTRKAALNLANEGWWLPTSDDISAQITAGDPRYLPTAGDATGASGGFYQASSVATGGFFANDATPARIHRINDRVLLGEATTNDGINPFVTSSWVGKTDDPSIDGPGQPNMGWIEGQAMLAVSSPTGKGRIAVSGYGHTKGANSGAFTIGLNGFVYNDEETNAVAAEALYLDAKRLNENVEGGTWGAEIAITNLGDFRPLGPWHNSGGHTTGVHIQAGGGTFTNGHSTDVSSGIRFANNGAKFGRIIVVSGETGRDYTDAHSDPYRICLSTPNGYAWEWVNGDDDMCASLKGVGLDTTKAVGFEIGNSQILLKNLVTGKTQFTASSVTNGVNYVAISGAVTNGQPVIAATGDDSIVSLLVRAKGAGASVHLQANATSTFSATGVASAVNRLDALASATGNAVQFRAIGTDTDIDIQFTPKGTGNVRFGTHAAIAAETVTGYITIKDASGTVRKLAVVS